MPRSRQSDGTRPGPGISPDDFAGWERIMANRSQEESQRLRDFYYTKNSEQALNYQPKGYLEKMDMREKATIDAAMMEKRYTNKQLFKMNQITSQIESIQKDPTFNAQQKEYAIRQKQLEQMGILPADRPRLSKDPKGRGDGESWEENGILFWNDSGTKRQVDINKTPQGLAQKQELEALKEQKKLEAATEKEQNKYKLELTKMQVPDSDPNNKTGVRGLTAQEMRDRFDRAYPSGPKASPEEVQHAEEYLNMMIDRWGNTPPPTALKSIQDAKALLKADAERAW